MDHNINAHCSICNKGYHICGTCKKEKNFKPWRRVTDTAEHYKIYMAIHGYAITKNKEQAGAELQHCDLSDMNSFKPKIRAVIEEITAKPVNAMAVPKNKRK